MVVYSRGAAPPLDLGYLALFLGLRVNQIVMERVHAAGFANMRESHGYVIQHLIETERTISELAGRMEVSQQAASKAIAELSALGVIEVERGADRRARSVRLSRRGWTLVRMGRKIRSQLEKRLIRAAGSEQYETGRSIIALCLEELGGMERIRSRRMPLPR